MTHSLRLFVRPRSDRGWRMTAGFALAYLIVALFAYQWTVGASSLAIVWPCNGILAAGILLLPWRQALVLAAAGAALDFLSSLYLGNTPAPPAALYALLDLFEAFLAALLMRRVGGAALNVTDLRRLGAIVFLGALPAALAIGTLGSALAALIFHDRFRTIWPQWAGGDFLGMMIGAPTSLIIARMRRFDFGGTTNPIERALLLALLVALTLLVFAEQKSPFDLIVFPLVVLSAFRLSPPYMMLGAVVMTVVAATFSAAGRGPFPILDHKATGTSFLALQFFLAALVTSAVVPMAALAEKERNQRSLTRALDVARRAKHAAEQSAAQMRQVVKLQRLMVNELNHRVKNTLASVQSIASQTLRTSGSMPDARQTLNARLAAMAGAHDILTRESWEGANLIDIVETAIGPYAGSGRIDISGPMVRLSPKAALAFSLTFHELCTNAAKYGALSAADGKVEVHWTLRGRTLHLDWVEKGGPPAREPARKGFGTRMILGLGRELSGMANMAFTEAGLQCMIRASIEPAQVFGESTVDA